MKTKTLTTAIALSAGLLFACDLGFLQSTPPEVPEPDSPGDDLDTDVIYSHGPMKQMMPEQLLASVQALTGHDFGAYDITAPANPEISEYLLYCTSLGGCADHVDLSRNQGVGLVYVLTLDKLANAACRQDTTATAMLPPGTDLASLAPSTAEIDTALQWQYRHFFGVAPRESELEASREYIASHLAKTDPDTGDPTDEDATHDFESALRGHCMALLTSAKFLYF